MQDNSEKIRTRLTAALSKSDLSPSALAAKAGVSRSYLSQVIKGKRPLSRKVADSLSAPLNVSPSWLFFGDETGSLKEEPVKYSTKSDAAMIEELLSGLSESQLRDTVEIYLQRAERDAEDRRAPFMARLLLSEINLRSKQ